MDNLPQRFDLSARKGAVLGPIEVVVSGIDLTLYNLTGTPDTLTTFVMAFSAALVGKTLTAVDEMADGSLRATFADGSTWSAPMPGAVAPAPAPAPVGSNPVTYAIAGLRTWQVYTEADIDAVPWATLGAGDVVNIYHRAEPYRKIIRLRAQGTLESPVVVNGVTDASGNRPVFHGSGATVAAGCVTNDGNSVFNATDPAAWQYREAIGLLGTANGLTDPYDQQGPAHIHWRNLEITGCKHGAPWTDARGVSHTWSEASGMRIQNGRSVVLDNCVIHDNDFGYFTQSRDATEGTAVQEPVVRNCRIYGNGMVGRSTEHNLYVQARGPLIEGNFIGTLRNGALGSAYKSRSTGEVFRYNTVVAAQRLVDFVEPEEQTQGLNLRADQPFVHCYGNLFINDFKSAYGGSVQPIHLGQDKFPEEGGATKWVGGAAVPNAQLTDADLRIAGTATRPRTTVHEWGNAYKLTGSTRWTLTEYAGHVEHRGGSVWDVQGGRPQQLERHPPRSHDGGQHDHLGAGHPHRRALHAREHAGGVAAVTRQPARYGLKGTTARSATTKPGAFE